MEGKPDNALLFPGDKGEFLSGSALYRRFLDLAELAGLPRIRLHDLSHTFGTVMVKQVDIYTLQRMMGHRYLTTTEVYLH